MRRTVAALIASIAVAALAGCGSDDDTTTAQSTAAMTVSETAQTTSEETSEEKLRDWSTALTLAAALNYKGFECTDSRKTEARGTADTQAMCKTGASNGGGIYIFLSVYDDEYAMQSAMATKTARSELTSGVGQFAYVSGANWVVECPDGGPGKPGEVACQAAQETLGGEFTQ